LQTDSPNTIFLIPEADIRIDKKFEISVSEPALNTDKSIV
jgi:hypothetical protein